MSFSLQSDSLVDLDPVTLDNGEVLMIMKEVSFNEETFEISGYVSASRSTDGGLTWGAPERIAESPVFEGGAFTSVTGRALISWLDESSGEVMMTYSDDDGQTWAEPYAVTPPSGNLDQTFSQSSDSTLWMFYVEFNTQGAAPNFTDIYYRTSSDDGLTWSEEREFAATSIWEWPASVYTDPNGDLVAIYALNAPQPGDFFNRGPADIRKRTSTDGGQTWGEPELLREDTLASSEISNFLNVLREASSDTLWLVYPATRLDALGFENADVFYSLSVDGGATWGAPTPFTSYVASDFFQSATLMDGRPFVVFSSERNQPALFQTGLFYGIIGVTADDAPPALYPGLPVQTPFGFINFQGNPFFAPAGELIPVQGFANDESGVASVSLSYTVNGENATGPTELFDDGQHNDGEAGDGAWGGAEIGPFEPGDFVSLGFVATDIDGHTATLAPSSSEMPGDGSGISMDIIPFHNAGNITLPLFPEGLLGGIEGSLTWPADGGVPYLAAGGLVVGAIVDNVEQGVSHFGGWEQAPNQAIAIAQELSDQDISIPLVDLVDIDPVPVRPLVVDILQQSYQWSDTDRDDFIMFRYRIVNSGGQNLQDMAVGMYLDLDLPFDNTLLAAMDDIGGFDAERNLLYMYDNDGDPGTHIGLKLLGADDIPLTARLINPDQESAALFDDIYGTLTSGTPQLPTETDDYRLLLAAGTSSLPAKGDAFSVTFGLVVGESLEALQANADVMSSLFDVSGVAVEEADARGLPGTFELSQNYPNPFNPTTAIRYSLPEATEVTLDVYDMLGRRVSTLVNARQPPGSYSVDFDASHLANGLYLYTISAGAYRATRKMVVLK